MNGEPEKGGMPVKKALAVAVLAAGLTACGTSQSASPAGHAAPAVARAHSPAAAVIAARMKAAGVPVAHLAVYTAATDPNHELGRQGGYTSKVEWGAKAAPSGIEVFPTAAQARERDAYLAGFGPPLGDGWDYVAGTAVLRLSRYLTPAEVSAYKAAFRKAVSG